MENSAAMIWVYGRVQGVGFRYHTQEMAQRLQLSGYVRNLDDGSVEIYAGGATVQLDALLQWLNNGGPAHARVDRILTEPKSVGALTGLFSIRY